MPSGVVSNQMGGAARRLRDISLYDVGTLSDDENTVGVPNGGWTGNMNLDPHSAYNLSIAKKAFAFRAPDGAGIGGNTIGTFQGFDPAWNEQERTLPKPVAASTTT